MKRLIAALGLSLLLAGQASAASLPLIQTPLDPSQAQATANQIIQSVNQNAAGYQALNYLDNGGMVVNQRGAAERIGGTTSGPGTANYCADRWAVDTNVTSGAGYCNEVTSATGVTFAAGFPNMVSVYRKTGALTQPVCLEQAIKGARFQQLQSAPVILSAWIAKNTGAAAAATATFYLWTGTTADEGLGSLRSAVGMTASPALTPALTGLATAGTYTTPALTVTATRYSSPQITVPAGANEGIFAICFTPGAETAGTTDGILVTGAQLEQADPAQTSAGRFYGRSYSDEILSAQHYYVQWADNLAATFTLPGTCTTVTANTSVSCTLNLPMTQDLAAPVSAVATAASFGVTKAADGTAAACTTLAVIASSNSSNSIGLTCATTDTAAVGTMRRMIYANTGAANTITVNSDF